jgi:two-component system nitrogen regulation sensor histidine kinase NtrY
VSRTARLVAWLLVLHAALAVAGVLLVGGRKPWLLAVEAVVLCSALLSARLVVSILEPLQLARDSARLLQESDYTTRFLPVGQPEVDALVSVYNRMADHLREERVRAQEQQQFLARLLEVTPSGVVILDLDGRVGFANPAAQRLLDAGPLQETLSTLAVGETRVVPLWGGQRLRCHHGSFQDRGFARSFFTVDELTEELRRHERAAYEKLIRMLSHEVNNSVTAANSLLESCLTYRSQLRPEDRDDYEQALRVVIARTAQLSSFMRSFAEVVRLPPPRVEPTDLREALQSVATLLTPLGATRGVTWRWDVQETLPPVSVDRAQMEQVLVNVVKNAIEAIDERGTVTLRLTRRDGRPCLVVEDDGRGVPEDVRAQLFTPFFTTKEGGQGIGLAFAQEVLAMHRCQWSLEAPAGGPTRFTIVF